MPADADPPIAVDTSVAIPLLVATHTEHAAVTRWWKGRTVTLAGHAMAETYAVLTRLPGDLRLSGDDAARLMAARFESPLTLSAELSARLPALLAEHDIVGGAVYDALVALAALEHGAELATRDARALETYHRVGVRVILIPSQAG